MSQIDRSFIEQNVKRYSNTDNTDHLLSNLYSSRYNCWGFTAVMIGWEDHLSWIPENRMTMYLLKNTIHVNHGNVQNGDIAVYAHDAKRWLEHKIPKSVAGEDDVLSHTAIVIDVEKELLIHKPGGRIINVQNFAGTLTDARYGSITEFRRI